jgi:hypothetical protein
MRPAYRAISLAVAASLMLSGCFMDDDDSPAPATSGNSTTGSNSGNSGSGSGSTTTPTTPTAPTSSTTLSGVAMAGPIQGRVCAYPLSATGSIGSDSLACADTNSTGGYSLTWSSYAGNVILQATGNYLDEASGQRITLDASNPLRSTADCSSATCNAAITPLTEAALRTAATLTSSDLAAAYLKIAQAYGINATTANDAIAQLVSRLPAQTGSDTNARAYADLLAVVSQAQSLYFAGTQGSLSGYLDAMKSLLANPSGINDIRITMQRAADDWSANPLNTTHTSCSVAGNVLTCTLPTTGGNGQNSTGGGNYKLNIEVIANGISGASVVVNNVPKPDTQSEFCSAPEVQEQLNSQMNAAGTWTMNSCSFSGNTGTIAATVAITQPISMSVPYTVKYTYSSM